MKELFNDLKIPFALLGLYIILSKYLPEYADNITYFLAGFFACYSLIKRNKEEGKCHCLKNTGN